MRPAIFSVVGRSDIRSSFWIWESMISSSGESSDKHIVLFMRSPLGRDSSGDPAYNCSRKPRLLIQAERTGGKRHRSRFFEERVSKHDPMHTQWRRWSAL